MSKRKQNHFLKLYKPVHGRFERFCRTRVNGEMPFEDLVNETLLIAYKKLDELKTEGAFLSFLIGISIRILSNHHRKKKTESLDALEFTEPSSKSFEEVEQQFEVELLHQALRQLPEKQREALILFELTGFSIKEIAAIQDSSISAVKQRLARGRKELAIIVKGLMSIKK